MITFAEIRAGEDGRVVRSEMSDQDERGGHQPAQARPLRSGHDDLPRPRQVLLCHLPQHRLVTGLSMLASQWPII